MMSHKQLTQEQRYHLYEMSKMSLSQKDMATILGVCASTISRELKRNAGKRGEYIKGAHKLALARRKNKSKRRISDECWQLVEEHLRQEVSPEQVSIRFNYLNQPSPSPEWIYQYIANDKAQGGDLHTHLRCKKKNRKRYGGSRNSSSIRNRVSIEERPKVVDERSRFGDIEVDTVIGRQGGKVLVTLVERKSKLSLIGLSINKTAEAVKDVIIRLLSSLSSCVKTLTYDNGPEFAEHEAIDVALKSQGYFAHPYASWERGLSENTNGLIRQYLPKRMSFDDVSDEKIQWIMDRLNNRPRKALQGMTPNEVFYTGERIAFAS
jgi:IS30 family transposase